MLCETERNFPRNRVLQDRTNPIDAWDYLALYQRLRFRRHDIQDLQGELEIANRCRNVTHTLQMCLGLCFYLEK